MVKTVNPPGKWKVMVVDDEALRILNTVIKLADLTDEHVICKSTMSLEIVNIEQMLIVHN